MTPEKRAKRAVIACFETTAPTIETIAAEIRAAMTDEREAYTRAIQIHVTDLQQWLDEYREQLPANQWARAQGAVNGLAAAIKARQ